MEFSAAQIAALTGGRIVGNPDARVHTIAKIEEAGPGALSFIANPKYLEHLEDSDAGIILISTALFDESRPVKTTLLVLDDAYNAFAILLEHYHKIMSAAGRTGIEQPSHVDPSARLGEDVYVGAFTYISPGAVIGNRVRIFPNCYIGNGVQIGDDTVINPGVSLYHGCKIGQRVIIHSGTVLGSDGFGFAPQQDGGYRKIPQIGDVVVEDDVEIGSNTSIDRATMGATTIRRGAKLDNLIQIAHNVTIGENTVIAAQAGVSGSTRIGRHCQIGGQAGIVGHIQLADGTRINAQSGLAKSITEPGQALTGSPAAEYRAALKSQVIFRNLPTLESRLREVESTLEQLLEQLRKSQSIS